MKRLAIAAALVIGVSLLVFFLFSSAMHEDFRGTIHEAGIPRAAAGFVLAFLPLLHQALLGRRSRLSFTALPRDIVPFQAYTLPWGVMFIYGTFFVFALSGLGIFLVWLIGIATAFFITQLIPVLNLLFVSAAFFWIGSWIGARGEKRPFIAILGVILLYHLIAVTVNLALGLAFTPYLMIGAAFLYLIAGLVGVWRGRRARWAKYVQFLFHNLPAEKRPLAADKIYEEVINLSARDDTAAQEFDSLEEEIEYTS